MEEVVFMCVIFLFIILIYNHFFKLKEGLENCDLTGFKKKPPAEVNQMSSTNKAKYNCQLKVFNQKGYSKKEMKQTINFNKELEELIRYERNRQLNQFSLLYFKKLKQNTLIDEK